MKERPLTQMQQKFVDSYLAGSSIKDSAIMAGYSEHTAKQIGSSLLKKPQIKKAISGFRQGTQTKLKISVSSIIEQIADIAQTARLTSDKLKAYDMLLRHTGGYIKLEEIIDKLPPEKVEEIIATLLQRLDSNK